MCNNKIQITLNIMNPGKRQLIEVMIVEIVNKYITNFYSERKYIVWCYSLNGKLNFR